MNIPPETFEDACTCKDRSPTKEVPNTQTDEPLSMEERFGSGYTINRIGLVETTNRFSNDELRAMSKEYTDRKGRSGRDGAKGDLGLKAKPTLSKSGSDKCGCGAKGRNGADG